MYKQHTENERFVDTMQRIGVASFKEFVYATPILLDQPHGDDAYV